MYIYIWGLDGAAVRGDRVPPSAAGRQQTKHHLSIYVSLSLSLSMHIYIYLSIALSIYIYNCLCTYLSIYLSIYIYIYINIYRSDRGKRLHARGSLGGIL